MKHTNRWYHLFIFIYLIAFVYSCGNKKDNSLHSEALCDSLLVQASDSMSSNIQWVKEKTKRAMSLTNDSIKYYKASTIYARALFNNSQFDSATVIQQKALDYLEHQPASYDRDDLLSSVYNSFCAFCTRLSKTDEAIVYGKKALQYNVDKKKAPDININISDAYSYKGEYAQAALYLHNALTISNKYGLDDMKFPTYFALGYLYLNLKDYESSNKYFLKAEKDLYKRKNSEIEVYCNNRGNYFYFTKQYKKSEYWFNKGLPYAIKIKDDFMVALFRANLADIYLQLKEYKLCQDNIEKSESYFKSIKFTRGLYALLSIKIGLAVAQNNFGEANELRTIKYDDEHADPNLISIRYKYIEQLATKQAHFKEAYEYLKRENSLDDSVRNELTQKKIAELNLRYQQDTTLIKKEMLIQHQKAEVKTLKQKYYIWFLVSILICSAALVIYFNLRRRHKQQRQKYINKIVQYRISNIKNRISPHLLFNVLNHEMDGLDEEKKKHFYVLVGLLRHSLEMAEKESISLSDEIEFSKSYIELESIRGKGVYNVTWNIAPDVDIEKVQIIPMIMQIPIENSIKHGFINVDYEKHIDITVAGTHDGVNISISDNGVGYHPEIKKEDGKSTGTGMRVIRQTMQILNQQNAAKIRFNTSNKEADKGSGTRTDIFIPYHFKFTIK